MNQDLSHPSHLHRQSPGTGDSCLLTVVLPLSLEEEMLDLLRLNPELVPGFSVLHGHGIGQGAPLTTTMERVEGRARRVFVSVVMRRADVQSLVALLRSSFQSAEVFYWAVPLLESGRLV